MSEEQLVEEILYESHSLGVYDMVMNVSEHIKEKHPRMSRSDVYSEALRQVKFVYTGD